MRGLRETSSDPYSTDHLLPEQLPATQYKLRQAQAVSPAPIPVAEYPSVRPRWRPPPPAKRPTAVAAPPPPPGAPARRTRLKTNAGSHVPGGVHADSTAFAPPWRKADTPKPKPATSANRVECPVCASCFGSKAALTMHLGDKRDAEHVRHRRENPDRFPPQVHLRDKRNAEPAPIRFDKTAPA